MPSRRARAVLGACTALISGDNGRRRKPVELVVHAAADDRRRGVPAQVVVGVEGEGRRTRRRRRPVRVGACKEPATSNARRERRFRERRNLPAADRAFRPRRLHQPSAPTAIASVPRRRRPTARKSMTRCAAMPCARAKRRARARARARSNNRENRRAKRGSRRRRRAGRRNVRGATWRPAVTAARVSWSSSGTSSRG
jgi:hypothetical protein